jgi:outer membrane immunogenic protein
MRRTAGSFPFGVPQGSEFSIAASCKLDNLGTVRQRLGYLFTPTFLLYGTGGLAYGGAKTGAALTLNNDCVATPIPGTCIWPSASTAGSYSSTRAGWTSADFCF